jgi:hypothetical protein
MGVIASIDSTSVIAEPGAETSCIIRVRNTGMVVDQVLLDILGDASPWTTVEPAQINMLPGSDAIGHVKFRPPRSSAVAAGITPFAVRAMSTEDPAGSTIEEGTVEVTPFSAVRAGIAPNTARGRRSAKFRLIVQNDGNAPTQTAVSASDPDLLLEFRLKPRNVVAQPGTATFVRLRTLPKKRFMKGADRPLPFQALVQAEGSAPATVNGVMMEEQVLPTWLLPAIATIGVVAAALVALWFTVLKPQVHSIATAAASSAAAPLASSASSANSAAQVAASAASSLAGPGGGGTGGGPGSSSSPSASPGSSASAGKGGTGKHGGTHGKPKTVATVAAPVPVSQLVSVNAPPSTTFVTTTFAIPKGKTLTVSDLVFENPAGDTGLMEIRVGNTPLYRFGLANFRSFEYPFAEPLVFTHAAPLVLAVECRNTGTTACTDAVSFNGFEQSAAPATSSQ